MVHINAHSLSLLLSSLSRPCSRAFGRLDVLGIFLRPSFLQPARQCCGYEGQPLWRVIVLLAGRRLHNAPTEILRSSWSITEQEQETMARTARTSQRGEDLAVFQKRRWQKHALTELERHAELEDGPQCRGEQSKIRTKLSAPSPDVRIARGGWNANVLGRVLTAAEQQTTKATYSSSRPKRWKNFQVFYCCE